MKFTRGDIVEHRDGSIYVIEKVTSYGRDSSGIVAKIGTIVETTNRFHSAVLAVGFVRILTHIELDDLDGEEEGEK